MSMRRCWISDKEPLPVAKQCALASVNRSTVILPSIVLFPVAEELRKSCGRVAEELRKYGTPEIFNTDQGSQFTSAAFIGALTVHPSISISMDGRGRALDNIFVERLWRMSNTKIFI
jgi:transposase InsO family protein